MCTVSAAGGCERAEKRENEVAGMRCQGTDESTGCWY
jgi:hypothetical protein